MGGLGDNNISSLSHRSRVVVSQCPKLLSISIQSHAPYVAHVVRIQRLESLARREVDRQQRGRFPPQRRREVRGRASWDEID